MELRLHFLEARGTMIPWRGRMQDEASMVRERIDALVPKAAGHVVDVVLRRSEDTIPELGLGGSCFEAGLVTVTITPENPALEESLRKGEFAATLAHELHHSLRHVEPGYGCSLGEALVSEGLADRFAIEVTNCERPAYTHLPDGAGLATLLDRADAQLHSTDYDHAEWFFGSGDLPRWAGYGLGWHLVSQFLADHPGQSAASLVDAAAQEIIDAAWPLMRDLEGAVLLRSSGS